MTCESLARGKKCPSDGDEDCVPGCGCPAERPVSRDGKCIKETECACFFDGKVYPIGEVVREEKCKKMVCGIDGIYTIDVENCTICDKGREACTCADCHDTCTDRDAGKDCPKQRCLTAGCCCPPGTMWSEEEDSCVESCKCIYKNRTYNVNETWTADCHNCKCSDSGLECEKIKCNLECPAGTQRSKTKCCACEPIDACLLNGKRFPEGRVITDFETCQEMTCEADAQQNTFDWKRRALSCAKYCANNATFSKEMDKCCNCPVQPTTLVPMTTPEEVTTPTQPPKCRRVPKFVQLRHNQCPNAVKVDVGMCEGSCGDGEGAVIDAMTGKRLTDCKCCNPIVKMRSQQHPCKHLKYYEVVSCSCDHCAKIR